MPKHIQHTNKIKTNTYKYMEKAQIHPLQHFKEKTIATRKCVTIYEETETSTRYL